MWIFAGGMQRSASTLQYQIAAHLVESRGLGRRLPWAEIEDHESVISAHKDESDYLVFKTHVLTEPVREQIFAGNAKCLYSHRDIRDVISSLKAKDWLRQGGRSITDWVLELKNQHRAWHELPSILSLSYPQLLFDLPGCVQAIAEHIGMGITPAEADQIAELYSVDAQREKIHSQFGEPDKMRSIKDFKIDPESLLHENHITNPSIGRYKTDLTHCEMELISVASQLYEFKSWLDGKTIRDDSDKITQLTNSSNLLTAKRESLFKSKIESLSSSNNELLAQVQALNAQRSAASARDNEQQAMIQKLTSELEDTTIKTDSLLGQIQELSIQYDNVLVSNNELQKQINNFQEQVQGLQEQIHALENLRHENNILKVLLKERTKGHLS